MEKTVKKRKCTGGFTLVELIVVIAILGILAGVGTVAYTGYITATRKGVDRTLVGDLIYAAQLADYANPSLFDGSEGMIILSNESDAQIIGSNDAALFSAALDDSVGDVEALRLSYDSWGLNTKNLKDRLGQIKEEFSAAGLMSEDGTITEIGYADVADDYWEYMAETVGNAAAENPDIEDGSAEVLMVLSAYVVELNSNAKSMGDAWADRDGRSPYREVDKQYASNSVVQSAVVMSSLGTNFARDMAFARYLEKNASYEGMEDDLAALKNPTSTGDWSTLSSNEKYQAALNEYYSAAVTSNGKSQAYIDGVAFYTFMSALNQQYGDDNLHIVDGDNGASSEVPTIDNMPEDFWADGASYVSWAASIGRGESSITEMETALSSVTGNAVIILVDKTSGELEFQVSPADANPQDGEEDKVEVEVETPTEAITVTITEDSITVNPTEIKTTKGDRLNYTRSLPAGWTFKTCTVTNSNEDVFSVTFTKTRGVHLAVEQLVSTTNTEHSPIGTATLTVTMKNNTTGAEKTLTTTISLKALN